MFFCHRYIIPGALRYIPSIGGQWLLPDLLHSNHIDLQLQHLVVTQYHHIKNPYSCAQQGDPHHQTQY